MILADPQNKARAKSLPTSSSGRVLQLDPSGLRKLEGQQVSSPRAVDAPPPGVPLAIGGGIAAGIGGVLIGTSVTSGKQLALSMDTPGGWVDGVGDYRSAQTRERVGWATLGVGGAVLVAGLVQSLVEAAARDRRKSVVAKAGLP